MIAQLKTLLHLKKLKEVAAIRLVHTKRREVLEAREVIEVCKKRVRASLETLAAREDAVYRKVLGRVVDFAEIDLTKGKLQMIEVEHGKLVDAVARAVHVHDRLENELAEAIAIHHKTVKDRDKYVELTEGLDVELNAHTARQEESEVEELFGNRVRKLA